MTWTLAFGGAISLLAALTYAYTGWRFAARRSSNGDREASWAFALWWFLLAAYTAAQAAGDVAGAAGATPLGLFVAIRYLTLVVICFAFAGLTHYVTYLRWGHARWARVAWPYYALLALLFVVLVTAAAPSAVVVQRWRTDVAFVRPFDAPVFGLGLALALLPVLVATGTYLGLARWARPGVERRRVRIVGWGLVLTLVAMAASRASNNDAVQLVARPILGAGVALVIANAYRSRASPRPPAPSASEGLLERIRQLV